MAEIECDDRDTERCLRRLHDLVLEHGGFIDPRLRITSEKGHMRMFAPFENDGDKPAPVISLTPESLLPGADWELGLSGDDIEILSMGDNMPAKLAETYIELFNLTHKIRDYRAVCPWIYAKTDPEFFERLIAARREPEGVKAYPSSMESEPEKIILKGFMKTRPLGARFHEKNPEPTQVYMPVMDLINHHPRALGFCSQYEDEKLKQISVLHCTPYPGSDECAVMYGSYDSYDIFLHYNYVEAETFFVRSVPLEFEIPDLGTMKINAISGRGKVQKVAKELQDLRFYLPPINVNFEKNLMSASYLLIPQEKAPFSMRRVLSLMIRSLRAELDQDTIKGYVEYAEQQIISENVKFYQGLKAYIEKRKTKPGQEAVSAMAKELADLQLAHIVRYPFYEDTMSEGSKERKEA